MDPVILLPLGSITTDWVWLLIFTRCSNHTQRRTTVGRTPLNEWSVRRRDLYLTTHNNHNRQTSMPPGRWPATSWVHYTTSCNTQSRTPEDGQNNCPKHVELTGIINKPLLLHPVGCLYYLYLWCTVKQISDNEIYLLMKYIKSVLWRVAKRLPYIEDAGA